MKAHQWLLLLNGHFYQDNCDAAGDAVSSVNNKRHGFEFKLFALIFRKLEKFMYEIIVTSFSDVLQPAVYKSSH